MECSRERFWFDSGRDYGPYKPRIQDPTGKAICYGTSHSIYPKSTNPFCPTPNTEDRIMQQVTFGLTPQYASHLGGKGFKTLIEFTSEATRLDFLFSPHARPTSDFRTLQMPVSSNNPPPSTEFRTPLYNLSRNSYSNRPPQRPFDRNNQPVPRNQNRPQNCFACNSNQHLIRNCPAPNRYQNRNQGNADRGGQN